MLWLYDYLVPAFYLFLPNLPPRKYVQANTKHRGKNVPTQIDPSRPASDTR